MSDRIDSRLSPAAEEAINTARDRQLEAVQDQLERQQLRYFTECYEIIRDWVLDECLVIDLDVEQCLRLIEEHTDELDLEIGPVTPAELRRRIDTLAAMIVHQVGEQRAHEAMQEVEEFLEERDLELADLRLHNPFAALAHAEEEDEGDWYVYRYSNPDGANQDVNVYEYTVGNLRWYVEEWLNCAKEASTEEE